jgi:hypothetical protein
MEDDSWAVELSELIEDIRLDREPVPGLADALAVLRIVERIYEASGSSCGNPLPSVATAQTS